MADRVYGILGYYDGILDGVADFQGMPHAFELAGDLEEDLPLYRLKKLTASEFELFSEYWKIWRRWEDFPRSAQFSVDAAVLPDDQARHDEIYPLVKQALAVSRDSGPVARGDFRPSTLKDDARDGRWGGFEVEWRPQ
jgi:hypothetical protein